MSTHYFLEKSGTAHSLVRNSECSAEVLGRAWFEVSLAWRDWTDTPRPDELAQEYAALERAMTDDGGVGPAFGGKHIGVWEMSLNRLTPDELQVFRTRLLAFLRASREWGYRSLGWDDRELGAEEGA